MTTPTLSLKDIAANTFFMNVTNYRFNLANFFQQPLHNTLHQGVPRVLIFESSVRNSMWEQEERNYPHGTQHPHRLRVCPFVLTNHVQTE